MARTVERRVCSARFEVRDNTDGTVGLRGYAAVFDVVAHGEVVRSSAFNRTLAQRDDVRLLVNHDGVPLARTKSGTMTLTVDDHGLLVDVASLDMANPTVQELVSAMRRGDIDQMSFAFSTPANGDAIVAGVRELREVILWDASIVTYPWYDATSTWLEEGAASGDRSGELAVSLRSLAAGGGRQSREDVLRQMRAAPPGKQSYSDTACAVLDAIDRWLHDVTGSWPWIWLEDIGDDWAVYCVYSGGASQYWQLSYSIDSAGGVSLSAPFPVELVCEYRPKIVDPDPTTDDVDQVDEDRSYTIAEARALLGLDTAA